MTRTMTRLEFLEITAAVFALRVLWNVVFLRGAAVFLLMALAVRDRLPFLAKAAILWSVAMGFWGTWFWNVFIRH